MTEDNSSKKDLIASNFSRSARSYDSHSSIQKQCARMLADLIGHGEHRRILEVGCGTGSFTGMLVDKWDGADVMAVDISGDMIEVARERVNNGRVEFRLADAETLETDSDLDLITSNASFQWFENLDRTFGIFHKKLKPGGVLCFSMYGPETFRELKSVLASHYGARRWLSSSRFIPRDTLESMVGRHFGNVEMREEHFTECFESLMDLLQEIKHSGTRGEGLGGSVFLGKYAVAEMERNYLQEFGGIIATHHVYFCRAEKR